MIISFRTILFSEDNELFLIQIYHKTTKNRRLHFSIENNKLLLVQIYQLNFL